MTARTNVATSAAGLALFGVATGLIAQSASRPFLWLVDLPLLTPVAILALAVAAYVTLERAVALTPERDPQGRALARFERLVALEGALAVLVALAAAHSLPSLVQWVFVVLGGLGLVLFAENAVLALRYSRAVALAPPGAGQGLTAALKALESGQRRLLAFAALGTLGAIFLAPTLFGLVAPGLGASLEARSLYGAALLVALFAAASLGVLAWRQRSRS